MPVFSKKIKDNRIILTCSMINKERINNQEVELFNHKYISCLFDIEKKGKKKLIFSGPFGQSLEERMKKPILKHDFFAIVSQILKMQKQVNENGLKISKVMMNPKYIYYSEYTREIYFLYLPIEELKETNIVMNLIYQLLNTMKPADGKDGDFIAKFSAFMQDMAAKEAGQISEYIQKEDHEVKSLVSAKGDLYLSDQSPDMLSHYVLKSQSFTSEDTGVLNAGYDQDILDDDTGLLGGNRSNDFSGGIKYPKLLRVETDEEKPIDKAVFRVGKDNNYADFYIANNPAISRNHAEIITRGNRYFVIDLNSTNKTMVNGYELPGHQEFEIFDGDHVTFADEEFIFKI